MSVLVYVFGALLAVGGLGLFCITLYNLMPHPAAAPVAPGAPSAPAALLPSQKNYAVDEEEFRNWIEVRDALAPSDAEALKSHVAVLVALFGRHPEAPNAKPA